MMSPHRSEVVAARVRLERLRAEAVSCSACADRRASPRRALAAIGMALAQIVFGALSLALGLGATGTILAILYTIAGGHVALPIASGGVVAGGYHLLARMAKALWPNRERECRWSLVAVILVFALVTLVVVGLVAALFSGPIAHA